DLARRAEAALECVGPDERVNEGVLCEALDRRHLAAADRVDEGDAREHRHAVELHRAGAAVALAAGDLGAGEAEVEPQCLRERAPDGSIELIGMTVDAKPNHSRKEARRGCPQGGSAETSSG